MLMNDGVGRLWPNFMILLRYLHGGTEKIMTDDIPAKIRTGHLPNTSD
jgi:hypothetical protein